MSSDYNDRRPFRSTGVFRSFSYATQGLIVAIMHERNLRIHIGISIITVVLGLYLNISTIEWLFVVFAIGGMISLELMNTALERIVDLVTSEYHPLAKQAKDISAGAVFVYSILSVVVGLIIFLPKVF